ncbi:Endo-type membrane-bound lytic murein transglycosylase A [Buchnera aphidicola (Thelaxes suberi)]|uniref:transglycosylase SLT domain-containing protein n=1 Tax=Buchnera aphidicola TaxID=9 RepID=UPI00346473C2
MKKSILISLLFLMSGCTNFKDTNAKYYYDTIKLNISKRNTMILWSDIIHNASKKYMIEEKLINAIVYVKSHGNPVSINTDGEVGLMHVKGNIMGKKVYNSESKKGTPSLFVLLNPRTNIDIGCKFIQLLQNYDLKGIKNKKSLIYATVLSYTHGSRSLFHLFDLNRIRAIEKINAMSSKEFFQYIETYYPSSKAIKELKNIISIYNEIRLK